MSLEQKRLQLLAKFSDVVVGLTNPGWQTVPEPWSSGCEAPIAEPCVGPWIAARVGIGRSEPATAGVRDKLAVVYKICCSCIMQRLVDQEGQLELDSLSDGSQWSCLNTGVMWSRRRVQVTSRATAFCTDCRRLNRLSVMPLNRALQ